jgi:hypothetical protein
MDFEPTSSRLVSHHLPEARIARQSATLAPPLLAGTGASTSTEVVLDVFAHKHASSMPFLPRYFPQEILDSQRILYVVQEFLRR